MIRIEKRSWWIDSSDEKVDEKEIDWGDFFKDDEEESLFEWKCNYLSSEWKQEWEKKFMDAACYRQIQILQRNWSIEFHVKQNFFS